jgi:transcriptional regulator with XRE-family HTH domain
MSTLGQNIAKARIDKRLKQKELSALTGLSQKYISMVERDRVSPRFALVLKIARALGVSLDALAPDDDEDEPRAA